MPPNGKVLQFTPRKVKAEKLPDVVLMCWYCHDRPRSTWRFAGGLCDPCLDERRGRV